MMVRSRPQKITMGKSECRQISTAVWRWRGQDSPGPSGVAGQSKRRTRSIISDGEREASEAETDRTGVAADPCDGIGSASPAGKTYPQVFAFIVSVAQQPNRARPRAPWLC